MSRSVLVLAVLAACGKPSPPDPEQYRAMTEEQRCEAVAPRAAECIDDLMLADLRALGADKELSREVEVDLRSKRTGTAEAMDIARISCRGGKHFADAVIACWAETSCDRFVRCIDQKR